MDTLVTLMKYVHILTLPSMVIILILTFALTLIIRLFNRIKKLSAFSKGGKRWSTKLEGYLNALFKVYVFTIILLAIQSIFILQYIDVDNPILKDNWLSLSEDYKWHVLTIFKSMSIALAISLLLLTPKYGKK